MNLRQALLARTLVVAVLTGVVLLVALLAWTIHDTRREIESTRALVRATVEAVARAQAGQPEAAASEAASPRIRHVYIGVDGVSGSKPGAASHGPLDRLVDNRVDRIPLPGAPAGSDRAAVLEVGANARSEFAEHLAFAATAFAALALFVVAVVAIQYRVLVRALAPVETFTARLEEFEQGKWSTRLPEPELDDLAEIARSFNRLAATLEQTVESQERLSRTVLSLRAEERERLARELHDDLGQALTALSVHLALYRKELEAGGQRAEGLEAIDRGVRALRATTRTILGQLREGGATDELGRLDPQALVDGWRREHAEVVWSFSEGWLEAIRGLRVPEYNVACRVIQEALTNAFRHGKPTHIDISVASLAPGSTDAIQVAVENDGAPATAGQPGFGIRGMSERATAAGGGLEAGPAPDGRWRVVLRLPQAG